MKKKNLLKKLGALAMAAALTMGMSVTSFAYVDDENAKGSITVHKYGSMTTTGEVGDGNVITDTSGFGTPLENVGFSLKPVTLPTLEDNESLTGTYKINGTGDSISVTFNVTGGTDTTKLGTVGTAVTSVSNSGKTDAQGVLVFGKGTSGTDANDLAQGVYLLEETSTPAGYEAAAPTLITVPMTNATGDGHLFDIHVYPKNISDNTITKTLNNTEQTYINPGENFTWTIKAGFTDKTDGGTVNDLKKDAAYGTFSVTDILSEHLTYVSSVVKVNDATTLTENVDYTVDTTTVDGQVKWTLTNGGIDKAIAAGATELTVEVTTVYNSFGTTGGTETGISNSASYVYTPADGDTPGGGETTTDPKVPKVNLEVVKTLSAAATAEGITLDGIQFALATKADVKLNAIGVEDTNGTSGFVLGADKKPIVVTTDENGRAIFEGLAYEAGVTDTYYLIEVETKDGLQLKQDAIEVKLNPATYTEGQVEYTVETGEIVNYLTTETDPDNPTFQLPLTGGIGSVIFIAVGALIVLGGVAIVLRSRKRQ